MEIEIHVRKQNGEIINKVVTAKYVKNGWAVHEHDLFDPKVPRSEDPEMWKERWRITNVKTGLASPYAFSSFVRAKEVCWKIAMLLPSGNFDSKIRGLRGIFQGWSVSGEYDGDIPAGISKSGVEAVIKMEKEKMRKQYEVK